MLYTYWGALFFESEIQLLLSWQVFEYIFLRHKVDISIFQWQENVNFCNIFVGKMIADDLKSKIWKICEFFFLISPPDKYTKYTHWKKYDFFSFQN